MKHKHTPGPLFAYKDDHGMAWHVSNHAADDDSNPHYIRTARTTDTPNAEADARLYSTAPDLLASLKQMVAFFDACRPGGRLLTSDPDIDYARLAIRRAEGGAK